MADTNDPNQDAGPITPTDPAESQTGTATGGQPPPDRTDTGGNGDNGNVGNTTDDGQTGETGLSLPLDTTLLNTLLTNVGHNGLGIDAQTDTNGDTGTESALLAVDANSNTNNGNDALVQVNAYADQSSETPTDLPLGFQLLGDNSQLLAVDVDSDTDGSSSDALINVSADPNVTDSDGTDTGTLVNVDAQNGDGGLAVDALSTNGDATLLEVNTAANADDGDGSLIGALTGSTDANALDHTIDIGGQATSTQGDNIADLGLAQVDVSSGDTASTGDSTIDLGNLLA